MFFELTCDGGTLLHCNTSPTRHVRFVSDCDAARGEGGGVSALFFSSMASRCLWCLSANAGRGDGRCCHRVDTTGTDLLEASWTPERHAPGVGTRVCCSCALVRTCWHYLGRAIELDGPLGLLKGTRQARLLRTSNVRSVRGDGREPCTGRRSLPRSRRLRPVTRSPDVIVHVKTWRVVGWAARFARVLCGS